MTTKFIQTRFSESATSYFVDGLEDIDYGVKSIVGFPTKAIIRGFRKQPFYEKKNVYDKYFSSTNLAIRKINKTSTEKLHMEIHVEHISPNIEKLLTELTIGKSNSRFSDVLSVPNLIEHPFVAFLDISFGFLFGSFDANVPIRLDNIEFGEEDSILKGIVAFDEYHLLKIKSSAYNTINEFAPLRDMNDDDLVDSLKKIVFSVTLDMSTSAISVVMHNSRGRFDLTPLIKQYQGVKTDALFFFQTGHLQAEMFAYMFSSVTENRNTIDTLHRYFKKAGTKVKFLTKTNEFIYPIPQGAIGIDQSNSLTIMQNRIEVPNFETRSEKIIIQKTVIPSTVRFSDDSGVSATDLITNKPIQIVTGTLNLPLDTSTSTTQREELWMSIDSGETFPYRITKFDITGKKFTSPEVRITESSGIVFRIFDRIKNSFDTDPVYYVYMTQAPTQTITVQSISSDTGTSSTDFMTAIKQQTITALLSEALIYDEILEGSVDSGTTWTNIDVKQFVTDKTIKWNTELNDGTHKIMFRLSDLAGNVSDVTGVQEYTVDSRKPDYDISIDRLCDDTQGTAVDPYDKLGRVISIDPFEKRWDFLTKTKNNYLLMSISKPLEPEDRIEVSLDGGSTWSNVSDKVSKRLFSSTGERPEVQYLGYNEQYNVATKRWESVTDDQYWNRIASEFLNDPNFNNRYYRASTELTKFFMENNLELQSITSPKYRIMPEAHTAIGFVFKDGKDKKIYKTVSELPPEYQTLVYGTPEFLDVFQYIRYIPISMPITLNEGQNRIILRVINKFGSFVSTEKTCVLDTVLENIEIACRNANHAGTTYPFLNYNTLTYPNGTVDGRSTLVLPKNANGDIRIVFSMSRPLKPDEFLSVMAVDGLDHLLIAAAQGHLAKPDDITGGLSSAYVRKNDTNTPIYNFLRASDVTQYAASDFISLPIKAITKPAKSYQNNNGVESYVEYDDLPTRNINNINVGLLILVVGDLAGNFKTFISPYEIRNTTSLESIGEIRISAKDQILKMLTNGYDVMTITEKSTLITSTSFKRSNTSPILRSYERLEMSLGDGRPFVDVTDHVKPVGTNGQFFSIPVTFPDFSEIPTLVNDHSRFYGDINKPIYSSRPETNIAIMAVSFRIRDSQFNTYSDVIRNAYILRREIPSFTFTKDTITPVPSLAGATTSRIRNIEISRNIWSNQQVPDPSGTLHFMNKKEGIWVTIGSSAPILALSPDETPVGTVPKVRWQYYDTDTYTNIHASNPRISITIEQSEIDKPIGIRLNDPLFALDTPIVSASGLAKVQPFDALTWTFSDDTDVAYDFVTSKEIQLITVVISRSLFPDETAQYRLSDSSPWQDVTSVNNTTRTISIKVKLLEGTNTIRIRIKNTSSAEFVAFQSRQYTYRNYKGVTWFTEGQYKDTVTANKVTRTFYYLDSGNLYQLFPWRDNGTVRYNRNLLASNVRQLVKVGGIAQAWMIVTEDNKAFAWGMLGWTYCGIDGVPLDQNRDFTMKYQVPIGDVRRIWAFPELNRIFLQQNSGQLWACGQHYWRSYMSGFINTAGKEATTTYIDACVLGASTQNTVLHSKTFVPTNLNVSGITDIQCTQSSSFVLASGTVYVTGVLENTPLKSFTRGDFSGNGRVVNIATNMLVAKSCLYMVINDMSNVSPPSTNVFAWGPEYQHQFFRAGNGKDPITLVQLPFDSYGNAYEIFSTEYYPSNKIIDDNDLLKIDLSYDHNLYTRTRDGSFINHYQDTTDGNHRGHHLLTKSLNGLDRFAKQSNKPSSDMSVGPKLAFFVDRDSILYAFGSYPTFPIRLNRLLDRVEAIIGHDFYIGDHGVEGVYVNLYVRTVSQDIYCINVIHDWSAMASEADFDMSVNYENATVVDMGNSYKAYVRKIKGF